MNFKDEVSAKLSTFEELLAEKVEREGWSAFGVADDALAEIGVPPRPRNLVSRQRPDLNGKILENQNGTLFTVIGGIAYGFTSDTVFRRIHYRCYTRTTGDCGSWWPPRSGICVTTRICPRFHPFENWPDVQTSIMDPLCSLRVSPINGAVYLIRSGFRHGITSARAFDNYQFDWDDVKPWDVSVDLWNRLQEGTGITETIGGRFDS